MHVSEPADRFEPWGGRPLHFIAIGGAGMSGLALVAAQRELSEMTQRARGNRDMTDRLRNLRRQLRELYSSINGSGVRQGSLFPPTTTQRQRWEAARAELEQLRRDLAAGSD